MNINDAFPSKYISAADLQGRDINVTISQVIMEDLGDENKPVVYFAGGQKGWVLNRINWESVAFLHGPETDSWAGKTITLYNDPTIMFGNKRTGGIRVRPQTQAAAIQSVTTSAARSLRRPSPAPAPTRPGACQMTQSHFR